MAHLNEVNLIGYLGRDPEVRHSNAGDPICNLSLATTKKWKKDNATHEATEWHRIVIFNRHLGEIAQKYATKGSQLFIRGELRTRKWTDSDGTDRYTTEIVVGEFGGALQLLDRHDGSGDQGGA